jgi:hypothetical protein
MLMRDLLTDSQEGLLQSLVPNRPKRLVGLVGDFEKIILDRRGS